MIHPWTCGKIFPNIIKDYVVHVQKKNSNILLTWIKYFRKDLILFMRSCSCSQAHGLASLDIF